MSRPMQITLRGGERIYINGAVVRVDRKVTLELLNDVTFLLEAHVLQAEQATTPLRQLYFILQTILMDPPNAKMALDLFRRAHIATLVTFQNEGVLNGLRAVAELVERERFFDALRMMRALFDLEADVLAVAGAADTASKAA
ncbi:MAG TPA: flagellar biosynthesis repressor FlbT [Bauldia sp.]|nr:flagellar biosynthesis repressor FlbT [Bauldia sp.]